MQQAVSSPVVSPPKKQAIRNRVAFLEKKTPVYVSVLGILGILVIWEVLSRMGVVSPTYVPAPISIVTAGWGMLLSGEIHQNVLASLYRIASGYAIGVCIGIAAGLLLGFFRWVDAIVTPIIYSLYPIPKIALLPLFILWLGIGETPKITIIAVGVFFPVVINTYSGVRNVDPILIKAAVTFGAKPVNVIRKVILPASLPMIFAGLKLSAGYTMLLLISAEMIAADKGVGAMILHYGNLMMTTNLMVGIVILSVWGLLFNRTLAWAERKLLPWK